MFCFCQRSKYRNTISHLFVSFNNIKHHPRAHTFIYIKQNSHVINNYYITNVSVVELVSNVICTHAMLTKLSC